MARWKLMVTHYLNVPGEEWEYTENDRVTGRPKRVKFAVPRLLDINDPSCWTNRWGNKDNETGEIVVCHTGKGEPTDTIFIGDPTPDMMPLDNEAREISVSFEHHWSYKPDEAEVGHSQSLIDKFQIEMADAQARPVEIPGLTELTAAIGQMAVTNQKLLESLAPRRI